MADEQKLLDIRLQMEALITEREGMIAENIQREHLSQSMAYTAVAFEIITSQLSSLIGVLRSS